MELNKDGTFTDAKTGGKFIRLPSGVYVNLASRQPIFWDLVIVSPVGMLACLGAIFHSQAAPTPLSVFKFTAIVAAIISSLRISASFSRKTVLHPVAKLSTTAILFFGAIGQFVDFNDTHVRVSLLSMMAFAQFYALVFAAAQPSELETYL